MDHDVLRRAVIEKEVSRYLESTLTLSLALKALEVQPRRRMSGRKRISSPNHVVEGDVQYMLLGASRRTGRSLSCMFSNPGKTSAQRATREVGFGSSNDEISAAKNLRSRPTFDRFWSGRR